MAINAKMMRENRKTVCMREGTRERGKTGESGLAAGGGESQGRERAREIGQMTAPPPTHPPLP